MVAVVLTSKVTSKRPANDQQTTSKRPNKKVEKVENGKKEKKDTNVSKENTAPSSLDVEFDIFWRGCQRKVDKDKARAAWKRMRKEKHTDLTATELMERYNKAVDFAVEAYGSKTKSPMPSTWINKRRWNDEIEEPPKKFPFTLPQMEEGGYSGAIYPDLRGQRFYMEPREGGKVFDEQGNELNLIESDGEGYVAPRLCGTK